MGDLLVRSKDVGIVTNVTETTYGLLFKVHWTWAIDGRSGTTDIHESQLSRSFFTKFSHIKIKTDKKCP